MNNKKSVAVQLKFDGSQKEKKIGAEMLDALTNIRNYKKNKIRLKAASFFLSGQNVGQQLMSLDKSESLRVPNDVDVKERFEYTPGNDLLDMIDDLTNLMEQMIVEYQNKVL